MTAAFIKIDGALVDDALLADVVVTQGLNTHSWCEIDLRQTEDKRFPAEDMLGKDLQIVTHNADGSENKLFSGLIIESELEYEIYGSYGGHLIAVSRSYLMDLTPRRNYFSQMTRKDAASKLVSAAGLALQGDIPVGASRDFHQLEESDFQFLQRLVDDAEAWLRPTENGIEVSTDFKKGVDLTWREENELLSFRISGRLSQPSCNGSHYDYSQMKSAVFEKVQDKAEFFDSAGRMVDAAQRQSKALFPPDYIYDRCRTQSLDDFQNLLKKESRRSMGRTVKARGESQDSRLRPGDQVNIQGVLDAQGVYGIISVVHQWTKTGYTNHFECTPWKKYTTPQTPHLNRFPGLIPARVVDQNDPENWGRVQVQFYWQEDSYTTWLPMMAPHAGADRGFLFLPEVGDEVWVAFEEGDPERGRVLGCAWNGVHQPPREEFWGDDVSANDVKRIVTKSGHRISIIDKDGKNAIVLATPKHLRVSLIENSNETGDSILSLHSDGDIFLNAPNGRIHFRSKLFSREVGS